MVESLFETAPKIYFKVIPEKYGNPDRFLTEKQYERNTFEELYGLLNKFIKNEAIGEKLTDLIMMFERCGENELNNDPENGMYTYYYGDKLHFWFSIGMLKRFFPGIFNGNLIDPELVNKYFEILNINLIENIFMPEENKSPYKYFEYISDPDYENSERNFLVMSNATVFTIIRKIIIDLARIQ